MPVVLRPDGLPEPGKTLADLIDAIEYYVRMVAMGTLPEDEDAAPGLGTLLGMAARDGQRMNLPFGERKERSSPLDCGETLMDAIDAAWEYSHSDAMTNRANYAAGLCFIAGVVVARRKEAVTAEQAATQL